MMKILFKAILFFSMFLFIGEIHADDYVRWKCVETWSNGYDTYIIEYHCYSSEYGCDDDCRLGKDCERECCDDTPQEGEVTPLCTVNVT